MRSKLLIIDHRRLFDLPTSYGHVAVGSRGRKAWSNLDQEEMVDRPIEEEHVYKARGKYPRKVSVGGAIPLESVHFRGRKTGFKMVSVTEDCG